jgi:hypothetical protein
MTHTRSAPSTGQLGIVSSIGDVAVGTDIIALLIEALKGIGATDSKLLQAHTKADHHKPSGPGAA